MVDNYRPVTLLTFDFYRDIALNGYSSIMPFTLSSFHPPTFVRLAFVLPDF